MGLIRCPECGTQISDKARECPKCGFPIYLEVNSSIENKICDFCGSENEHYAKFCTNCGAGLARTAEKEPVSEPLGACIYCGKLFPQGEIVEIEGKNYCRECVPRLLAEQKNLNANMAYNYAPPPPVPQYSNYVPTPDYNQDYSSHKSKAITLLLCIFFGYMGIHQFYSGKIGMGILYLFTGGLFGFGWIIDIIRVALGVFRDSRGLPIKY